MAPTALLLLPALTSGWSAPAARAAVCRARGMSARCCAPDDELSRCEKVTIGSGFDAVDGMSDRFQLALSALRGEFSPGEGASDTERDEGTIMQALTQFPTTVPFKAVSVSSDDGHEVSCARFPSPATHARECAHRRHPQALVSDMRALCATLGAEGGAEGATVTERLQGRVVSISFELLCPVPRPTLPYMKLAASPWRSFPTTRPVAGHADGPCRAKDAP